MSALTQARAQNFLNAEFRAIAYAALGTARGNRLMTANGDQVTAGTELAAGGGYAAGGLAITFTAATAETGTYSAKVANDALSYTNMPAATIVGVEVWDNATTPVRAAWGALSANKAVAAGDTLSIPAGQETVSI